MSVEEPNGRNIVLKINPVKRAWERNQTMKNSSSPSTWKSGTVSSDTW